MHGLLNKMNIQMKHINFEVENILNVNDHSFKWTFHKSSQILA